MGITKEVSVCKADDPRAPATAILIEGPLPAFDPLPLDPGRFYDEQAAVIVDALFSSLPQGTCDRLVVKVLERRLSILRGLSR